MQGQEKALLDDTDISEDHDANAISGKYITLFL